MPTINPSDRKMAELIVYIANRSQTDDRFGATKLNKILFFADFRAYQKLGKSITGQDYRCLEYGPAPLRLIQIRDGLVSENALTENSRVYGGREQRVPAARRHADLGEFSAEEISLVDGIIHELWNKSASEVSEMSHQFSGWRLLRPNETIPYPMALVGLRELLPEDRDYGLALEEEARACK